ncbi:hypothetical protein [Amycolatopsis sp. NPDC102389]|uniref:hypothetical protein n=1 Tax=Amycolatopsis sp. NPDC102389 TaxID=3363941 RepID=UPI003821A26B
MLHDAGMIGHSDVTTGTGSDEAGQIADSPDLTTNSISSVSGTRTSSRLHDQSSPDVLETPPRYGGPISIRKARLRDLASITCEHPRALGAKLVEDILAALDEQTAPLAGTCVADKSHPGSPTA